MLDIYGKGSGVTNLSIFDFKGKKLNRKQFKNKMGLVIFYAPWCKHCIKMVPLVEELAHHFKGRFFIGAINCDNIYNYNLRWRFNVYEYPTIRFVDKKGNLHKYDGCADKDSLLEFISNKLTS